METGSGVKAFKRKGVFVAPFISNAAQPHPLQFCGEVRSGWIN